MSDPFAKVSPGDPIGEPSAALHNAMIDAARWVKDHQATAGAAQPRGVYDTAVLPTETDVTVEAGQILGINGPLFTPDDSEEEFRSCPQIKGTTPDESYRGKFCVAIETIEAESIGHTVVSGIALAKLLVSEGEEAVDRCDVGTDVTALVPSATGSAKILWPVTRSASAEPIDALVLLNAPQAGPVRATLDADYEAGDDAEDVEATIDGTETKVKCGGWTIPDGVTIPKDSHVLLAPRNAAPEEGQDIDADAFEIVDYPRGVIRATLDTAFSGGGAAVKATISGTTTKVDCSGWTVPSGALLASGTKVDLLPCLDGDYEIVAWEPKPIEEGVVITVEDTDGTLYQTRQIMYVPILEEPSEPEEITDLEEYAGAVIAFFTLGGSLSPGGSVAASRQGVGSGYTLYDSTNSFKGSSGWGAIAWVNESASGGPRWEILQCRPWPLLIKGTTYQSHAAGASIVLSSCATLFPPGAAAPSTQNTCANACGWEGDASKVGYAAWNQGSGSYDTIQLQCTEEAT